MDLTTIIKTDGMTPEQEMTYLGTLYENGMKARITAMRSGLMAIHDAWVRVTNEIRQRQDSLLVRNPELVFMVMPKE